MASKAAKQRGSGVSSRNIGETSNGSSINSSGMTVRHRVYRVSKHGVWRGIESSVATSNIVVMTWPVIDDVL